MNSTICKRKWLINLFCFERLKALRFNLDLVECVNYLPFWLFCVLHDIFVDSKGVSKWHVLLINYSSYILRTSGRWLSTCEKLLGLPSRYSGPRSTPSSIHLYTFVFFIHSISLYVYIYVYTLYSPELLCTCFRSSRNSSCVASLTFYLSS